MDTHPSSSEKHLFLVATSTEEKIERYQTTADAMGLPFVFINLKKLSLFHSALEDTGTREGNVRQKMDEINAVYDECRNPESLMHAALMKLAEQYGVNAQQPDHIHFAADDATFTVPGRIWPHLWPKLATMIELDLLASAEANMEQCGPGAETGPILAAVGVRNFYNMVREAAIGAGYGEKDTVKVFNHTTFSTRSLADPVTRDFHGSTELPLRTRHQLHEEFHTVPISFDNTESWFVNSNSFAGHPEHPEKSVRDDLRHSSEGRYGIVEGLAEFLGMEKAPPLPSRLHPLMPEASPAVEALPEAELTRTKVAVFSFPGQKATSDVASIYELLQPIEQKIRESEAFLFKPLSTKPNLSDRQMAQLYLTSVIVAKQLEPRDIDKPVAIMNLKGSGNRKGGWEDAVEAILDGARKGMIKDYDPRLYGARPLEMDGVIHQMNSYFDVVSGTDEKQLNAAALMILETRQKHRIRFHAPQSPPARMEGNPPPDAMFKVAVWTSATSDNKRLLDDMRKLGGHLARKKYGLVWGAGDRHGMGAVFDGYHHAREGNDSWVGAFSTPPILISETKYGDFPKDASQKHLTDYRELNTDIYERMAHMIGWSDAIVVAPGGAGTSQEWLTALMVKRQMPEKMKNKPLVIFAPDLLAEGKKNEAGKSQSKLFWERSARAFLGTSYWEDLKHSHGAKAQEGVYLTTSEHELELLIDHLHNPSETKPETLSSFAEYQPGSSFVIHK